MPELAAALRPAASIEDIRGAERTMGVEFPAPLRELYLLHDGEEADGTGLFWGLRFLPLDEVVSSWHTWSDLEEAYGAMGDHYSVPSGWIKESYINVQWIPFAEDGGGNHLGVDLDPDEQGLNGQIINFGRDEQMKYVIARNLTDFLQFLRDELKNGRYTVERDDIDVMWNYGEEGHFLDAIRNLSLPVIDPIPPTETMADNWQRDWTDNWLHLIQETYGNTRKFTDSRKIYLIGKALTDIGPLAQCTKVQELVLTGNEISDLGPLRHCRELKVLYLAHNPVVDLEPLAELPLLSKLIIPNTKVLSLAPLADLPKLRSLNCENAPVEDLSPLLRLKNLRELVLNDVTREQLATIARMVKLTQLTLSLADGVTSNDLTPLGNLKQLASITISNATLPCLDFLLPCTKLSELELQNTAIADISSVAKLPSLRSVKLSRCPNIGNLEALATSLSIDEFTGSFAQFSLLKDLFPRKVDFSTITGGMTKEEEELWLAHVH
nr:leucine-rich repeat domain-containing protein [Paenibacillus phyllosphaerae]